MLQIHKNTNKNNRNYVYVCIFDLFVTWRCYVTNPDLDPQSSKMALVGILGPDLRSPPLGLERKNRANPLEICALLKTFQIVA